MRKEWGAERQRPWRQGHYCNSNKRGFRWEWDACVCTGSGWSKGSSKQTWFDVKQGKGCKFRQNGYRTERRKIALQIVWQNKIESSNQWLYHKNGSCSPLLHQLFISFDCKIDETLDWVWQAECCLFAGKRWNKERVGGEEMERWIKLHDKYRHPLPVHAHFTACCSLFHSLSLRFLVHNWWGHILIDVSDVLHA